MEDKEKIESPKKLRFGDNYVKKDKSKYNDKLWQAEKGTRYHDDESIEINVHPISKVESSSDLLNKEEFLEKEVRFNHLIETESFFNKYLELKNLKKLEQNECWKFIVNCEKFKFLDISELFMFFTEYFVIKPEKLFKNLNEEFKKEIFKFLKIEK